MFTNAKINSWHAVQNLKTRTRSALVALALAGSLGAVAVATPVAASAATVSTGPGGISYNADLVHYPYTPPGAAYLNLYTSGPMKGCAVMVGDHYRTDGRASGEGEVWCNAAHNYSMKVYLEYQTSSGHSIATSASSSWGGVAGTWWYLSTDGMCEPGGPATTYNWTTSVEISVDGSTWQGWFTSRNDAPYQIPPC